MFDSTIQELCNNFDLITEIDSRGSLIWLIGEFSEKIDSSVQILNDLSDK